MIKKIFLILVLLVVIVAAAIYFLGSSALNKGIKRGVETFGPQVTQTPVTLDSVNLSVLSGEGTLSGLIVGNPEGFKSENIFALGQIDIAVDKGSLLSDKIVINKIHIRKPEISYEKTMKTTNVKELMKNIEAFTGPSSDTTDEPSSGAKKQLVIKQLIIEDGTIYVGALGIGQTVALPRIEMNDIGEGGNKTSIADVLDLVLGQVVKSIGPAVANVGKLVEGGGKAILDAAQQQGTEKVGEAAGEAVNKATEGLKSLFGN
jgi:uncharacterized protein involved in outer membrane biogenesis